MDVSRISNLEKVKLYKDLLDYKVHRVGDNILLTVDPPDLTSEDAIHKLLREGYFKRIIHRAPIKPHFKYVATASLPSAGNSFSLENVTVPDWQDWLVPSSNTMYDVILGFLSSHYSEWLVRHVGREQGWIKATVTTDQKWTQGEVCRLICTETDKPGDYDPHFVLYNYSQQTLLFAQARVEYGWKYVLKDIPPDKGIPKPFTPVIVADVESA